MQPGQQAPELTPQVVQNAIIQLKKALSQTDGEIITMRSDVQGQIFGNFMQITNGLFQKLEKLTASESKLRVELDKIYQAHPEIKIAAEKEKKDEKGKKAK